MINKDYSEIVLDRTPLKLSRVKLIVWHFNWTNVKVALLCKSIYCFSFLFSHLTSVILLFLFYLSFICAGNLSTTILSFPSKTLPPFSLCHFPLFHLFYVHTSLYLTSIYLLYFPTSFSSTSSQFYLQLFLSFLQPTEVFITLVIQDYSAICRPSDHTVGSPRAEIRTRDGRSRGKDTIATRPPHLLPSTSPLPHI